MNLMASLVIAATLSMSPTAPADDSDARDGYDGLHRPMLVLGALVNGCRIFLWTDPALEPFEVCVEPLLRA